MREPVFTETMQIALVVRDLDATMRTYVHEYGIGPWEIYEFNPDTVSEMAKDGEPAEYALRLALTMVGSVQWELIQPLDDKSMYAEFLATKGEGLHHVAVGVPELRRGARHLRAKGRRVLQAGVYNGVTFAYLSTDEDLGCHHGDLRLAAGPRAGAGRGVPVTLKKDRRRQSRMAARTAHRSAPTTSAACCARRSCCRPEKTPRPAASTATRCAPRGRRDPGGRAPPGGGRSPVASRTASSGAPRGTWTSSTSSTASRRRPASRSLPQRGGRHRVHAGRAPRRRKLGVSTTIFGDDFRFLVTATTGVPKLTIPSPSMVHYRGGRAAIDPAVYPDMEEFWSDLTAAYREEVRRLGELGCTYLQLDDTSLAYVNDPNQREHVAAIGGDPEHQHLEYIPHINEALAGRPEGMSVTTHLCRGNFRSSWAAEGATTSSPRRC